jgi:hypothetical protein
MSKSERAAQRAALALQAHIDEKNGFPGPSPGSPVALRLAALDLLVDLKHLLYQADYRLTLEDLAAEAVDLWAEEED